MDTPRWGLRYDEVTGRDRWRRRKNIEPPGRIRCHRRGMTDGRMKRSERRPKRVGFQVLQVPKTSKMVSWSLPLIPLYDRPSHFGRLRERPQTGPRLFFLWSHTLGTSTLTDICPGRSGPTHHIVLVPLERPRDDPPNHPPFWPFSLWLLHPENPRLSGLVVSW